jgi:hypothetical protein
MLRGIEMKTEIQGQYSRDYGQTFRAVLFEDTDRGPVAIDGSGGWETAEEAQLVIDAWSRGETWNWGTGFSADQDYIGPSSDLFKTYEEAFEDACAAGYGSDPFLIIRKVR